MSQQHISHILLSPNYTHLYKHNFSPYNTDYYHKQAHIKHFNSTHIHFYIK